MSRYIDRDDGDDSPEAVLAQGRWAYNARRALNSSRGREALAAIREALLALPEPRLIQGAMCTVGGPERVPVLTEAEIDAHTAELKAKPWWDEQYNSREQTAQIMREERDDARRAVKGSIESLGQGCGVCALGALLWHRLVKQGMTVDEAFAALPAVAYSVEGDPLSESAEIAARDAGITYTLALELGFRNDETYRRLTPEGRWSAFLAWIDTELGDSLTAGAVPATAATGGH